MDDGGDLIGEMGCGLRDRVVPVRAEMNGVVVVESAKLSMVSDE